MALGVRVQPVKRKASFRVRVSADVFSRLERLAEAFGVPVATLGALAVGRFLASEERGLVGAERVAEAIAEGAVDEARKQVAKAAEVQLSLLTKKESA